MTLIDSVMPDPFEVALEFVLSYEGIHEAPDSHDPGGDTWYGLARASHPTMTPWPPSLAQATDEYRRSYWLGPGCNRLPTSLAIAVFDAAVNEGTGTAIRLLQRTLGVAQDGVLGPVTEAAARQAEPTAMLRQFLVTRLIAYTDLSGWPIYRVNWTTRVLRCYAYALGRRL